ncbi:hypothetical protein BEWA_007120 [Theileria equi strain WA]|uniref:Ribosomal RNA-processing protein 42 n=1 Tax=Theileria equi strain WA TaxID=1537102 RepID=L0B1B7_THEEQ|nr:hypothetical protein BEWA_007120 [Theileria equi strain WA]AFZ81303.1 hypothetical protein BEWA_007120 [Theileria equi strain WA]|eukprot:XP_004830969.1 hypothetical protein BEWA_007120 [Theileria equi strain WA]
MMNIASEHVTLSQESVLASEVYRHVDPFNFFKTFFKEGLRPDGRQLMAYRTVKVENLMNIGEVGINRSFTNDILISSIILNAGNTHMHCSISATLERNNKPRTSPELLKDLVTVSLTVSKHATTEIYDVNGPCINISHLVSNLLENILNSSDVLPREQFALDYLMNSIDDPIAKQIVNSKLRWKLNVSVSCEEYDGNIMDWSVLSVVYALLHSKLPIVFLSYDSLFNTFQPQLITLKSVTDGEKEHFRRNALFLNRQLRCSDYQDEFLKYVGEDQYLTKRLEISSLPYTITFCKCMEYIILDPTREEEQIGTNISVYAKKISNELSMDIDDENIKMQLLNLMGCTGISDDEVNKLFKISRSIINKL